MRLAPPEPLANSRRKVPRAHLQVQRRQYPGWQIPAAIHFSALHTFPALTEQSTLNH